MKNELNGTFEKFIQRHNRQEHVRGIDMSEDGCDNKNCAFNQFLQIQRSISVLPESLER